MDGQGTAVATLSRRAAIVALAAVTVLGSAALGGEASASSVSLRFAAKTPGKNSTMRLFLRYTRPGQPGAKPSPIRHLVIDAPAGTRFHSRSFPACEASDAEVMADGPAACPAPSRIGGGPIAGQIRRAACRGSQ